MKAHSLVLTISHYKQPSDASVAVLTWLKRTEDRQWWSMASFTQHYCMGSWHKSCTLLNRPPKYMLLLYSEFVQCVFKYSCFRNKGVMCNTTQYIVRHVVETAWWHYLCWSNTTTPSASSCFVQTPDKALLSHCRNRILYCPNVQYVCYKQQQPRHCRCSLTTNAHQVWIKCAISRLQKKGTRASMRNNMTHLFSSCKLSLPLVSG